MKQFSARETVWLQELDGIELAGFRRRAFAFLIDWSIVGMLLSVVLGLGGLAYVGLSGAAGKNGDFHFNVGPDGLEKKLDSLDAEPASTAPEATKSVAPSAESSPDRTRATPATDSPHPHVVVRHIQVDKDFKRKLALEAVKVFSDIVVPCLYFGLFLWRWNGQTPGKRWMKIRVVSLVHPHMTFWHSVERALGYGAAALEAGFGFIQYWLHPYRRCAQDRLAETIVVTERSFQVTFPTTPHVPDEPTTF